MATTNGTPASFFQVIVMLFPKEPGARPLPLPEMARGWLLHMVATADPFLAEILHADGEIRPYAIQRRVAWATNEAPRSNDTSSGTSNPIPPANVPSDPHVPDPLPSRSGRLPKTLQHVSFIINIFRPEILQAFQGLLAQPRASEVRLGEHHYLVGELRIQHRTIADLFFRPRAPPSPPPVVRVTFLTPTYFRTTRGHYPVRFPAPDVLLGNLVTLWNAFVGGEGSIVSEDFLAWVGRSVFLSDFRLHTSTWSIGKPHPVRGVVGTAYYRVKEHHAEYESLMLAILRLGTFTNVGASRTAGAGQIRVDLLPAKQAFHKQGTTATDGGESDK